MSHKLACEKTIHSIAITMRHVDGVYQAAPKPVQQPPLLPACCYRQWSQTGEMTMECVTPVDDRLTQLMCLYLDELPNQSHTQHT